MDRRTKLMQYVDESALGLEIGASHLPIAPKRRGYNVHTLDHMPREELIDKFRDCEDVDVSLIEEVDFVWKGEPYAELLGPERKYKWILASHVIEHTPDFVGFFLDCASVLADDGILSLAVPDKRCCFDRFRPITGLSQIVDSHLSKRTRHTPGTIAESNANMVLRPEGPSNWEVSTAGPWQFQSSLAEARSSIQIFTESETYIDCHAWCFVPHSFRLLIHDLHQLGLLPFQEVAFYSTKHHEFFITLGRQGKGIDKTRLEMLELIELELAGHRTAGGETDYDLLARTGEVAALREQCDTLQRRVDELEGSTTYRFASLVRRGLSLFRSHRRSA